MAVIKSMSLLVVGIGGTFVSQGFSKEEESATVIFAMLVLEE
jgi:hypothetical protein